MHNFHTLCSFLCRLTVGGVFCQILFKGTVHPQSNIQMFLLHVVLIVHVDYFDVSC